jgi:2-methylcitrate dehydratase PrpD
MTLPEQRMRVIDSHMPDINLRHVIALYLVDGGVGFASLHDHTRMTDPEILRVAERISVAPRPGAGRRDMVHFTLTTTDGRKFHMEPDTVRGQPANPMTREEIVDKALDLLGGVLGAGRSHALIAQIMELPKVADIRDIRHLWQA